MRLVVSLIVDYFDYAARPGASARRAACHVARRAARHAARLAQARRQLLRLRRASGCLGTLHDSSRGSSHRSSSATPPRVGPSSATPPRAGPSSTTSRPPRVRVPRHVAQLVTRLIACRRLLSLRRVAGCLGTSRGSSCGSCRLVVDYSASCRLVVDYSASRRLVIDYFASAARPGASARLAARLADRRAARHRLLRLRHASGCLDTSRGSSLVVDYFAYTARPGASVRHAARHVARCAARRRLLHLRRSSRCLGTSRGPSHGSSSTTPCAATSSCGHAGSTSAVPCVVTTCLTATLALLQVCRAPPRRRLPVASRRPFISISFPN
jgi:hypothetical protein